MKKLALAFVLGLAAIVSAPAIAANATSNVPISITLTPVCTMTTPGTLSFAYTSFQGTASTATGGAFTISCTTSLPYKVGYDATATPAVTKTVAAAASNLQLGYSLALSGSATGVGTGLTAINLSVTGSMASGQSGTCATSSCTGSDPQAVYVVY